MPDHDIHANTGALIKQLRKDRGFTQKQFRELIGIGARRMSQIETGQTPLNKNDREKIIKEFRLPKRYFSSLADAETLPESAKRVIEIRTFFEMTQAEFSEKIGITQPNLSSIESGRRPAGKYIRQTILRAFDINPVWWETGEGRMLNSRFIEE